MYMCVYMYICMWMYTCNYVYIYIYTYIYVIILKSHTHVYRIEVLPGVELSLHAMIGVLSICEYMHIYMWMYTYKFIYIYIYTYTYVYIFKLHTLVYQIEILPGIELSLHFMICVLCICVYMCIYISGCIHVSIYIYTYIHIHMYIYSSYIRMCIKVKFC